MVRMPPRELRGRDAAGEGVEQTAGAAGAAGPGRARGRPPRSRPGSRRRPWTTRHPERTLPPPISEEPARGATAARVAGRLPGSAARPLS